MVSYENTLRIKVIVGIIALILMAFLINHYNNSMKDLSCDKCTFKIKLYDQNSQEVVFIDNNLTKYLNISDLKEGLVNGCQDLSTRN
jgi:hypothetical protein